MINSQGHEDTPKHRLRQTGDQRLPAGQCRGSLSDRHRAERPRLRRRRHVAHLGCQHACGSGRQRHLCVRVRPGRWRDRRRLRRTGRRPKATPPDLLRLRHRGAGCDLHLARPRPVADPLRPRRPQRNHHARQRRIDPRHATFSSCEAVAALLSGGIRAHASLWRGVRCRLAASGLCRAIPSRLARASEKWEAVLGKITKNEKLERDNHSKLG